MPKGRSKDQQSTIQSLTTKKLGLKDIGVDVLEGDRWKVNSRESTDKELPIQDYD